VGLANGKKSLDELLHLFLLSLRERKEHFYYWVAVFLLIKDVVRLVIYFEIQLVDRES